MSATVLFVSVKKSFNPAYNLSQMEPYVERAWAMTVAKAASCDRVVAVLEGEPIAAWPIRATYPTEEMYATSGGERPRVGLSLGDPLPILPAYRDVPALRHGSAAKTLEDLNPLPVLRDLSVLGR